MILIIKSTHSLSTLLTDRSSDWWATQWVSIHLHSHSLSQWSEHNSYTVMTMNTIDSKEKDSWWNTLLILEINSLFIITISTEWSDLNNPSLTIPFVSLINTILSVVRKDRLLFVSIHRNLCPTNTLHCSQINDWLWDITILFDYLLIINPYTWIRNSMITMC